MHNTGKELKNIFNFSISTWVNFIIGFLSTFVLTRLFVPEVLGVINLFYSTVSTLMSMFCFGLDSALIRFFYKTPNDSKTSTFIFNLLIPSLIAIIIIGGISVLFWGNEIAGFFLGKRESLLTLFIVISVIDQVFLRYLNIIYRMETKIKDFNIQSIVINIVTKLSVVLGVLVDASTPTYALFLNVITVSLVTIYYSYKQRKEWLPSEKPFDYDSYNGVFKFAFWGWVSMLAIQVYALSSQLIVNNMMDLQAVGIFTGAGLFTALITVARGGFCTYWSAFMYKNYDDPEKQDYIKKMHDVILLLCIIFCAVLFSLRSVAYLLIGEEFRSSKVFFSLLLFFPILQTVQETTGYGISIKNKNHITTIIYFLTLLLNIILGVVWVKKYELIGVAFASYFSSVFMFCAISVVSQRFYDSIPNKKKTILGIILLLIQGIVPVYVSNDIALAGIMMSILVVSCFIYRDILIYTKVLIKQLISR